MIVKANSEHVSILRQEFWTSLRLGSTSCWCNDSNWFLEWIKFDLARALSFLYSASNLEMSTVALRLSVFSDDAILNFIRFSLSMLNLVLLPINLSKAFPRLWKQDNRKNSDVESQSIDLLIQSYKNAAYDNGGNVQLYLTTAVT